MEGIVCIFRVSARKTGKPRDRRGGNQCTATITTTSRAVADGQPEIVMLFGNEPDSNRIDVTHTSTGRDSLPYERTLDCPYIRANLYKALC